jgi:hypothetical protein
VVCPANNVYDYWCFREYEIPDTNGAVSIPNHVLAHSDSTIWYTAYFGGNHLGRLDPSTKQFQVYPLPQPRDEASCNYGSCICFFGETCPHRCCAYLIQGLGPGSVAEEASRNVVMSFQYQPAVGRFDFSRANDPACTQLDANGQNPCVSFSFLPSFNPGTQSGHSAAVDGNGNVWLTTNGPSSDCSTLTSVAYQQATTNRMLAFPPLSFYQQIINGVCVGFQGAGMAYDPSTGGMWFADFSRHRIGKMQPQ